MNILARLAAFPITILKTSGNKFSSLFLIVSDFERKLLVHYMQIFNVPEVKILLPHLSAQAELHIIIHNDFQCKIVSIAVNVLE